jgi:zinc protease
MSARLRHWALRALVLLCLVLLCLGQAASALAQPVATPQTSPGGLSFRHVLMPEDTHQALVFAWKDGTAIALPGKEALAALAPALMMEGPKGSTRSAMLEDLRDLQAGIGMSAGANFAQGQLLAPAPKFAAAGGILARLLADPALPEDQLKEAQRNRALASQQAAQNAETQAQRLLARLALGEGPYLRLMTADPSIFERVTKADIEAWRRNVLVRDGLVIVAAGPLTVAEVGREIDRIFAGLPQSGNVPGVPMPVVRSSGKLVVLERPVVQTIISAGGPTGLVITPDFVRAELAIGVLSGGFSGRLLKAVRERLGATYGISASLQPIDAYTRGLLIHTPVANDKAKDALATIRSEYARFWAEGVTEDEIEPLKTVFITRNRDRLRRAPSVAGVLLGLSLQGFPADFLATYDARVRSYGRAAINEEIRAKFPAPPLTFVMVAPSAAGLGADCVIKAPEEIARCE